MAWPIRAYQERIGDASITALGIGRIGTRIIALTGNHSGGAFRLGLMSL